MAIGLLISATLLVAFANGANDNFKATATSYGSGTLGFRSALTLATVAQVAGSAASIVLAWSLVAAFRGKGLVPDGVVAAPGFLTSVAFGAAGTVLFATRFGVPVSTTHALVGGLLGAGLGIAPAAVSWESLGASFVVPLVTSPVAALLLAAVVYRAASKVRERLGVTASTCVCVGERLQAVEIAADGTMAFAATGIGLSAGDRERCERRYGGDVLGLSARTIVDRLHLASAFGLGFARGLNDTPKVLALLVAASWTGLDPRLSLAAIALAMAAGGWVGSRRIAERLGHDITRMNRGQGLVANATASALVIGASLAGMPVSTTHVSTGAIIGIGLRDAETRWKLVGGIALAWIVTLPFAALLAFGAARLA